MDLPNFQKIFMKSNIKRSLENMVLCSIFIVTLHVSESILFSCSWGGGASGQCLPYTFYFQDIATYC